MRKKAAEKAKRIQLEQKQEFYDAIHDIVEHPIVNEMKKYPHHCNTDCYQHCLNVAYANYQICKAMGLDARAAARAGMLHDLFLYDWHTHHKDTGNLFHGLTHPRQALKIAEKYFELSPVEKDIILRHMWPITVSMPRTPEAFITTLTDKGCGLFEMGDYLSKKVMPRRAYPIQWMKRMFL